MSDTKSIRQFDVSLSKLMKVFYVFSADEGIVSQEERLHLLEALQEKITYEGLMQISRSESDKHINEFIQEQKSGVKVCPQ